MEKSRDNGRSFGLLFLPTISMIVLVIFYKEKYCYVIWNDMMIFVVYKTDQDTNRTTDTSTKGILLYFQDFPFCLNRKIMRVVYLYFIWLLLVLIKFVLKAILWKLVSIKWFVSGNNFVCSENINKNFTIN